MRIFLDANILFSAANQNSAVARLLNLLREEHTLWTSQYALAESEKNLKSKRPQWVANFELLRDEIFISPQGLLEISVELVEKERPILGSAIAGKCDYLVTGDRKDFGHLFGKTISGVKVVSMAQIAEDLL